MNTIEYNGVTYKTRTFNVERDGVEETIKIAPESLLVAMGLKVEKIHTLEERIDCEIYYYVMDNAIELEGKFICLNCLDAPVEFINEEF